MREKYTLDELQALINAARSPRDLFGADIDARLAELRSSCHPDQHPDNAQAETLFKTLGTLADDAKKPLVEIKSPTQTYRLLKQVAVGDIADIFLAEAQGVDCLVKVSRINGAASMIEQERSALKAIGDKAGATTYSHYFPALVESFPARDKFQKRINVFRLEPRLFTLEQVLQRHPQGLAGRHLGWVFKRLLTAIGFAHQTGFIHGAILPPHVLVHADTHGLQLIGWGQSVRGSQRIRSISTKFSDWYPPEVVTTKKPVRPATDIYMAARCIVHLAGTTAMPAPMSKFLRACLLEGMAMRPDDAWDLHDHFDEVLRGLYGSPKFEKLVMS